MDNHLTEIEIKDFKCFKDFKADGFKRVNLIGGNNNVGKTAFMEACFFNLTVNDEFIQTFVKAVVSIEISRNYSILYELSNANNNEYIGLIISFLSKYKTTLFSSKMNKIFIDFNKEIYIKLNNMEYGNNDLERSFQDTKIPIAYNFVSSLYISTDQLENLYDNVKLLRKRKEIDQFINEFDNDIIEYDIIQDTPVCFSKKLNSFVNLDEYGNGLKRYIAFVCAIWSNENGCIFIDEIENGVHYSNLDKLWEVILKTSKDAKCQVFAITHSKECIESYARVSEELKDEDISFISLYKDRENNIKSVTLNNQEIQDRIELGLDNR